MVRERISDRPSYDVYRLDLPTDKLNAQEYSHKLTSISADFDMYPHSTSELQMMSALTNSFFNQDGVTAYVSAVEKTTGDSRTRETMTDSILGFYSDAVRNAGALRVILEQFSQKLPLQFNDTALATLRRYSDTHMLEITADPMLWYIDDDYSKMDHESFATLLSESSRRGLEGACKSVYNGEQERAAFWLSQLVGYESTTFTDANGEPIHIEGLLDGMTSAQVPLEVEVAS